MRYMFEVFDSGHGVETVYEAPGHSGEVVMLIGRDAGAMGGAQAVRFVHDSLGATAVTLHPDSMVPAYRADQHIPSPLHASASTVHPGPPDWELLDDQQKQAIGRTNAAWDRVRANNADDADLLTETIHAGAIAFTLDWPDIRWLESLTMIVGNSAIYLYARHGHTVLPGQVLPALVATLDEYGWRHGGPTGMLEAHEAAAIIEAADQLANAETESTPADAPAAAAWHPDPTGRHQLRYWDGTAWTAHVADHGTQSTDPV